MKVNFSIVIIAVIVLAGAFGWGMNIAELARATEFSGLVVLRVIGIFVAPLGAILGYI